METTYRNRVASPYQRPHPVDRIRAEAYDTQGKQHPAREAIQKCLGKHVLTAIVEEDLQTLSTLRHVEGLVAFLCTLVKDGNVIAQGRGSAVLSPTNRFIQRTIACAFNAAFADAAIRSSKVLDTFRGKTGTEDEAEPATEKQIEYLRQLIRDNVEDDAERKRMVLEAGTFSKEQASKAIESLKR